LLGFHTTHIAQATSAEGELPPLNARASVSTSALSDLATSDE